MATAQVTKRITNPIQNVCTRFDFLKPDEDDLRPGNVVAIYTIYHTEEEFEGNARLIRREESQHNHVFPYVRAELGGTPDKDPVTVNWTAQRWLIEFVDGPRKGFRTHRYIAHFLCIDAYMPSGVDLYACDQEE